MIDLSNIRYRIVVMDGLGHQYNISNYIENVGWEENENEIAMRSSFTVRNDNVSIGYMSDIIKPGCLIGIFASDGKTFDEEVARGYVEIWNPSLSNSANALKCTCYDDLYKLQQSQDNRYLPEGTSTRSAIAGIFEDWQIPFGEYQGPDIAHSKQAFKNKYLSDILLELLDEAEKKGSGKYILRSSKGLVNLIPRGCNQTIYVFQEENIKSININYSTTDLVTRVKVFGQANDDGNSSVEATVNGLTQYGVRQKTYTRGTDENLEEAQAAAQDIINNNGTIKQEISIQSPDLPFIRKGDLVYLKTSVFTDYYYVISIQHDADSFSMTMKLKFAAQETVSENTVNVKKEYGIGDIVNFHGGTHYVSSYPDSKGYKARAGKAKITIKNGSGKAHPWHLIHEDSGSNVYGWVDDGTFD